MVVMFWLQLFPASSNITVKPNKDVQRSYCSLQFTYPQDPSSTSDFDAKDQLQIPCGSKWSLENSVAYTRNSKLRPGSGTFGQLFGY